MNTFLQLVAEDIYKKTGGDLSGTAIVFPNKRARLFFNEHLASQHNGLGTPSLKNFILLNLLKRNSNFCITFFIPFVLIPDSVQTR